MKIKIVGNGETRNVWVDDKHLDPANSQKVYNHSPDGFNWGYCGSGPSQLALAIMLLYLKPELASTVYQTFKNDIIATLPQGCNFETVVEINKYLYMAVDNLSWEDKNESI